MSQMSIIRSAGTFDSETFFSPMLQTPERVLNHYELELFVQDSGVSVLNGQEYPIRRGMLLLARPNDIRQSKLPFCNRFIQLQHVDGELQALLDGIAGVVYTEELEAFEASFANIGAWFVSGESYNRAAAVGELMLLLRRIHRLRLSQPLAASREMDVVAMAQRYIEQHYQEEWSVEDLAQVCHVSTPYLHRLFVTRLKTTPHNALMQRRIMAAKVMLINDPSPVAEVAWRCGFSSASYFSDCFRRWVGVSPRKFRQETGYKL